MTTSESPGQTVSTVSTVAANGRISMSPVHNRVQVHFGGVVVADSTKLILLAEGTYQPVRYFPIDDIRMELLVATDTTSVCPWKGTAHYWDIVVESRRSADAVWGYPAPHPDGLDLTRYVAFYPERVDRIVEDVSTYEDDSYSYVDLSNPS